MEVYGYKCFNKDLTNRYGMKFETGKKYKVLGNIKFGNDGNGFHFCKNMEDTFRYFDAMKNEVCVCLVKGSGSIVEHYDNYYGYYDMYSTEEIEILKVLNREEIINIGISLNEVRAKRFVSLFKLTELEKEIFLNKFKKSIEVVDAIMYYQENNKRVYIKKKYKN